ncbi:XrtA system polysaccharide chain length determinant [Rhodoferax fermentans]|uniref:Chain length-determining protein n=1 Tax=Rhodoferax fermentans TaxID=28066 RepID=A0A1T1ATJ1_RHOFE|nr:XrtA system polysaccharide chain length determinant [Rhodoferax fermentans]MBK1682236.1 chain length-determining protein [Rhodoferax fermentans]OOV07305.1 chain length-determining protein [Rhodoferax fermentans]
MDELISQITTIARGMWKHRWRGLIAAWLVAIVGAIGVMAVPDKYEASARIYVDTQSILKPLMSGLAVQPNVEQQVMMLSRTLITRPNVEKLIRMADLDLGNASKGEQDALIDRVSKTLEIKNVGRDNIYTLAYRDTDPEKAKKVVQSLVSIFVESSMGSSRQDSDTAKKFIEEQIKTYVTKLEEAEARLKEFKLRNIDLQTTEGRDMAGQLGAISEQLRQARLELREAENARDAAKKQLDAERATNSKNLMSDTSASISTPEIDSRIDAQKRNLDALLQRFTEQHPDVVGARRLIKDLEDQKRKEIQELRKAALANPSAAPSNNTLAYQELSRVMATSEVLVASLRARVAEYDARYAKAREAMKTAPQIEAEFAQLNRDYEINKKNYNDLVSRRESATMSGDLDNATGVADFRLIDPPRASPKPVAPNRLLLMPLALLAALAAGLGVTFLLGQIRAVFYDANAMSETLGLPLLGVVSLQVDDGSAQRRKSELVKFLAATGGLVVVFGLGMAALFLTSNQAG